MPNDTACRCCFVVVALCAVGRGAMAEPCNAPPTHAAVLLPADGAFVPRNAVFVLGTEGRGAAEVVGARAGVLNATIDVVDLAKGVGDALRLVRVAGGLPAGDTVQLQLDGVVVVTVVVEDRVDDEAPPRPAPSIGEPLLTGACPPTRTLVADLDDDAVALVATVDDDEGFVAGGSASGFGVGGAVVVFGEADAAATVGVAAVDAAGNVSPPADIDVVFPPQVQNPGSCSGCPGGLPGEPVVVGLALPLLRRRRRR